MAGIMSELVELSAKAIKALHQYRKKLTKKHYIIGLCFIALFVFLKYDLKALIIVTILALLASYSTIYKRYLRMLPSALELVTFGTVITSIAYGPTAGMIFGFTTTLASEIISAAVDIFTFLYIFIRAFEGFLAWHLYWTYGFGIITVGVLSSCVFIAIASPIYLLPGDFEAKMKAIYYFVFNIAMNFIVFTILGKLAITVAL
jgi:hypothetical protein